jgi:hypothetical protein
MSAESNVPGVDVYQLDNSALSALAFPRSPQEDCVSFATQDAAEAVASAAPAEAPEGVVIDPAVTAQQYPNRP